MNDTQPRPPTRWTLIARVQRSCDGAAWQEFVELYTPIISGYCRRKMPSLQEADLGNVCQDVLTALLRKLPSYDRARGRFRTWLGLITRTALRDFRSQQKRQCPVGPTLDSSLEDVGSAQEDPDWLEEHAQGIATAAFEAVEKEVSSIHMSIFRKLWDEQQSASDVAKEFGMRVAQIYQIKSRVRSRLRDKVLELAEDGPSLHPCDPREQGGR